MVNIPELIHMYRKVALISSIYELFFKKKNLLTVVLTT